MTELKSRCPLCGGMLTASELLDACSDLADATLGVLSAVCPYCQGKLEIRPATGMIQLGYLAAPCNLRFDVVKNFPVEGMEVALLGESQQLVVSLGERRWIFSMQA